MSKKLPPHSNRETPHTFGWFAALRRVNLQQASLTQMILQRTGLGDVCSICGDAPAPIYDALEEPYLPVRLCADCLEIQSVVFGTQLRLRDDIEPGES